MEKTCHTSELRDGVLEYLFPSPVNHWLMIIQVRGIFLICLGARLQANFILCSVKVEQPLSVEIKSQLVDGVHKNAMLRDVSKTAIASTTQCFLNFNLHMNHLGTLLK